MAEIVREKQRDEWKANFERDGYLVVKDFASLQECEEMRTRMRTLIDEWDGECKCSFTTTDSQVQDGGQGKSDYFFSSGDKVRFFLEADAVDPDTGGLRDGVAKHTSLNKVGHGLHVRDRVFQTYSNSPKVAELVSALGWVDPVLPQSMYIFKNPGIGGEVTSHQDSTFLFTTPRQTCLGLWLALHDATMDNGCLWARPGSHKEPVRRHMARKTNADGSALLEPPETVFETQPLATGCPHEGQSLISRDPRELGFVPVPIKAGDLFVIHGQVDHMSLPNTSASPRETFQLHLVEGPSQGVEWSPRNWLQYDGGRAFPRLGHVAMGADEEGATEVGA
jgi:phytanoyl-CoA hydroxylase